MMKTIVAKIRHRELLMEAKWRRNEKRSEIHTVNLLGQCWATK